MLEIDGSYGSGGGQILRTALGLAALTGKAFRLYNLRAAREKPGLKEQHLQAVNSVAQLCEADVKGAFLGSKELEFYPGQIQSKHLDVKISTAGSAGLVLQALLIPAIKANLDIRIEGGGTFGKAAPSIYYIKHVLAYWLSKIGCHVDVDVLREGFYPKGGAILRVNTTTASKLEQLIAVEKTALKAVEGISVASESLRQRAVAERQAKAAELILYRHYGIKPSIQIKYASTYCPGSGLQLWLQREQSIIGADDFGELRKSSEQIGNNAANKLIEEDKAGVVDSHATDQLLPYLALTGGKILASSISEHAKTNMWLIEKFLPVKFYVKGNLIEVKK